MGDPRPFSSCLNRLHSSFPLPGFEFCQTHSINVFMRVMTWPLFFQCCTYPMGDAHPWLTLLLYVFDSQDCGSFLSLGCAFNSPLLFTVVKFRQFCGPGFTILGGLPHQGSPTWRGRSPGKRPRRQQISFQSLGDLGHHGRENCSTSVCEISHLAAPCVTILDVGP